MIERILALAIFLCILTGCSKHKTYELSTINLYPPIAGPSNLKTGSQFVSSAYADLTGRPIPPNTLRNFVSSYESGGDHKLIGEMIVAKLLDTDFIPGKSETDFRSNPEDFIRKTYFRFFKRYPDIYEIWTWEKLLKEDDFLTLEMVYFTIMTSDEYRYY